MRQIASTERRALWSDRFESTDLTVAEFCRRESISAPSFYSWKKRRGQDFSNRKENA